MQIKRTSIPNLPPDQLAEGQLAIEMVSHPPHLWVGVPSQINSSGKRLVFETETKRARVQIFFDSGVYTPSNGIGWCWMIAKGGGGTGGHGPVSDFNRHGGGGGEGGTIWGFYKASAIAGATIVVGAGGAANVSYDTAGSAGGASGISGLCSVNGGQGGQSGTNGGGAGIGGGGASGNYAILFNGLTGFPGGNMIGETTGYFAFGGGGGRADAMAPLANTGAGGRGWGANMGPQRGASGFVVIIEF